MEENLSMQRHNALENATINYLNQFGDTNKLNGSVLRENDGNPLQFITIPRATETDYNLLSPESIAALSQNGLIVDVIQTLPPDSSEEMSSHHIYNGNNSIHSSSGQMEMANSRHFIASNENASLPVENIHQSIHNTQNHMESRSHFGSCMEENRKVIANEQCRQYMLPNEAPVIVLNKEATAMSTMTELDLSSNFGSSYNHIDHSVLSNSSRISQQEQAHTDQNGLPAMPHLTRITKIRGTPPLDHQQHHQQPQQHTIRYKTNTPNTQTILTMPRLTSFPKNTCFLNDDDLNCLSSNMKMTRHIAREPSIGPKKNFPPKKRITKKLKTISPNDDRMHAQTPDLTPYHTQMHVISQHDIDSIENYAQTHTDHLNRISANQQQTTSLNLTMNSQPIQLTTTRLDHSKHHTPEPAFSTSHPFTNGSQSIQSVQMEHMTTNEMSAARTQLHHTSHFTCDICATQTTSQLEFYKHLKYHYEPDMVENVKMESIRSVGVNSDNTVNTSILMESNQSNIFNIRDQRKLDAPPTIVSQRDINESVVLATNGYHRLPANNQDFNCIANIDHEPITDDDSITDYSGNVLNGIKAEQNEFSDTEDMLESGVLDNAQRVVDSYIENGTSEVKNLIELNENQGNIGDNDEWSPPTSEHTLSAGIAYDMQKHSVDNDALRLSNFPIGEGKSTSSSNPSHTVIERSSDLSLMYEINMNDKDFDIIDDSPENSLLRRQLIKTNDSLNQFDQMEAADAKTGNLSTEIAPKVNTPQTQYRSSLSKINIQDEFIEEEQTDSDMDAGKPNGAKKKRKIYRCRRCNKVCNSKNALHYHYLSHTGERNHRCEECGKCFFASSALKVHKRLHTGDKPYECNFCNRPFRQWGDLKYHIQSRHTKEKSHQCEFCGKDFARRYSLVIHRRIHTGEKNYKCEFCDKEFRASSYLQVHRKIHTGEKPFVCPVCSKRFRVRGDLKRHSNIHERNKAKEAKLNDLGSLSNESNSTKTNLFTIDENNTSHSRSTDTLDQLVSVIESTETPFVVGNACEPLKKRAHSSIDYQKSPSKYRFKRDARASDNSADCLAINYSTGGFIEKSS